MKTWYLLQWEYEGEKGEPFICDKHQLRIELGANIEDHHYSGDGNSIACMARFDGNKLTMLALDSREERRDGNDFLYWDYAVCDMDGNEEFKFTVKIDGRS